MFKIMIAEDDSELRQLYAKVLRRNGYDVVEAEDGQKAIDILDTMNVDLVISDIMMPHVDGYELVTTLRNFGYHMPVLMITAKDQFIDLQQGFISGADDYMVKPININEMVLRVQALLRRAEMVSERKYTIGSTVFEYDSLVVETNGEQTVLPQKEFQLLYKLISNCGKAYTRIQLMDDIWGIDSYTDPHTIDVHVNRLREKFGENPDFEIVTIRRIGYKAVRKNG